jgi:hypothetical protein
MSAAAVSAGSETLSPQAAVAGRWALAIAVGALIIGVPLACSLIRLVWWALWGRRKSDRWPGLFWGRSLVVGQDNRVSTSKTAAVVWTYSVAAGLLSFLIARWAGHPEAYNNLVTKGLDAQYAVLVGGPIGAAILAKGIVSSQLASGTTAKPAADTPAPAQLVQDDTGDTDLGDLQYLLFNLVALAFFYGELLRLPIGLPAIPDVLVGLTSVGAVGYVGNKALNGPAVISAVIPESAPVGTLVTLVTAGIAQPGDDESLLKVTFGAATPVPAKAITPTTTQGSRIDVEVPSLAPGKVAVTVVGASGQRATWSGFAVIPTIDPAGSQLRAKPGETVRVAVGGPAVARSARIPAVAIGGKNAKVAADAADPTGSTLLVTVPKTAPQGQTNLVLTAAAVSSPALPFEVQAADPSEEHAGGEISPHALRVGPPGPTGGSGSGPGKVEGPPMATGALVRTASSDTVYVIAGGAKFPIASQVEFDACHYVKSRIVTITDADLALYHPEPADGTYVVEREPNPSLGDRGSPRFFVDGKAVGFVTPDSQIVATDEMQSNVGLPGLQLLPVGALGSFPKMDLLTVSPTPSSAVFPPQRAEYWDPAQGTAKWWPRADTPALPLRNGATVIELRGWLTDAPDSGPNGKDPDWHAALELDPAWLDHLGVDWHSFYKLGDILGQGAPISKLDPPAGSTGGALLAQPVIHIELNGFPTTVKSDYDWPGAYDQACPRDWTTQADGIDGVRWPYPLTSPTGQPLAGGDYVRVSGSIVTDIPHVSGFGYTLNTIFGFAQDPTVQTWWTPDFVTGLAQAWDGLPDEHLQGTPARWTEIHPPDALIAFTPGNSDPHGSKAEADAIYGVSAVVLTEVLWPSDVEMPISFEVWPPRDNADHRADTIVVEEFVGPETNLSTIVAGNASRTGANITVDPASASATIALKIRGRAFRGVPGKFRAIYRVRWAPDPTKHVITIDVDPAPARIPLGAETTITVTARDLATNAPVSGQVLLGGRPVGATGRPLTVSVPNVTWRTEMIPLSVRPALTREPNGPTLPTPPERHPIQVPVLPELTVRPIAPYQSATIAIGTPPPTRADS